MMYIDPGLIGYPKLKSVIKIMEGYMFRQKILKI